MKKANDIALKEWAALNRALREGRQVFVLRKGGIAEEQGVFTLKEKEFFIFPAHEHQTLSDLQPAYHSWLEEAPAGPDILLDVYAEVDEVRQLGDFETAKKLIPFSVWSDNFVRKRLDYKPQNPLYLIVLKCFRAREPRRVRWSPDYAGCTSWVPLKQAVATDGFEPALPADAFMEKKKQILEALKVYGSER